MATTRARKGQTEKVFLGTQFTDSTGAAIDPTGTPTVKVFRVEAAGSLTLVATLNCTKQASLTGFYGAFLDVAVIATYPAGDYALRWEGVVSGITSASPDYFEIDDAATLPDTGVLAGAYCSEAQVRAWTKAVESVVDIGSGAVAEKAAWAAREIDGRLRAYYTVPFAGPAFDDTIVLLNIWLAAANCLESVTGSRGNVNELGAELRERADARLADIIAGRMPLSVAPRTDIADGNAAAQSSTEDVDRVFDRFDSASPMSRFAL